MRGVSLSAATAGSEVYRATYGVPGQLDEQIGQDEGLPAVCLRLTFSCFIQSSLGDEHRHNLLDELDINYKEQECSKHLVLQTLSSVVAVEEREADEESLQEISTGDDHVSSRDLHTQPRQSSILE